MEELALKRLYEECFPDRNAENELNFVKNAKIEQILHEIDGKLVGFLFFKQNSPDEIEIMDIGVSSDFRMRGIASIMFNQLINIAKDVGVHKVLLEVAEGNLSAMALYKKHGFKTDGIRKNYYKLGEELINAILMSKNI